MIISDKVCMKPRLQDSIFPSYKNTSNFMGKNLLKAEFHALKCLIRKTEVIIQKAGIDNIVVLLIRKDYILKTKMIPADTSKFKKLQIGDS